MIRKKPLECSFFILTRRDANLSDGELHSTEVWEWLDDEIFDQFNGGTVAPGLYDGFYRDPDTKKRVGDQSHKFIVAVSARQLNDLRTLLSEACLKFQQKCIYLSVAGEVEFIEAADHEAHETS